MTAGAELDRLVAEKAWPECTVGMAAIGDNGEDVLAVWKLDGERDWLPLPPYSTDITAAWPLLEKLKLEGWQGVNLCMDCERWTCQLVRNTADLTSREETALAETAALAICLAVLKAIEQRTPALADEGY